MRRMVFPSQVMCRGNHAHPRKGACLLEFAGALSGGPWTDHPAGVQPMLAALARAVNDATSDTARMALLPWAAWLVGTSETKTDEPPVRVGAVALRHASAAERVNGVTAYGEKELKVIRQAVAVIAAGDRHADETLRTMLAEVVNMVRMRAGLGAVQVPVTGFRSWPDTQPIEVEWRVPDGAESRYDHCTALPDRWPSALADAWTARLEELSRRVPVPA
jgi:hypothetical protein